MRSRLLLVGFLIFLAFCPLLRADDCGLRGYDGNEILKLDCEDSASSTSQLRVTTQTGEVRGLKLVETNAPNASKFRVRYSDASGNPVIKAIGFIPVGISSCEELQLIGFHPNYALSKDYNLATDIDCSTTNPANQASINCSMASTTPGSLWKCGYTARFPNGYDKIPASGDENLSALNLSALGSKGFKPIGPFSGRFDGKSKIISNLYINRPAEDRTGLFGRTRAANLSNMNLVNVDISGANNNNSYFNFVGALVGRNEETPITHCYAQGTVGLGRTSHTSGDVGGLIGSNLDSPISDSYAEGVVAAGVSSATGVMAGGLVGSNNNSDITNCHAESRVMGGESTGTITAAGGLIGNNNNSQITNSYAIGVVRGGRSSGTGTVAGGLIGSNSEAPVLSSFARATVTGGYSSGTITAAGGLVGSNYDRSPISNSYAIGAVVGGDSDGTGTRAGGLIGQNHTHSTVLNSYSAGSVRGGSGRSYAGGLIGGNNEAAVSGSYSISVVTAGGGTQSHAGGFIGVNYDDPLIIVNDWWFFDGAAIYGVSNIQNIDVKKADSASDFYGRGSGAGGAVYYNSSPWDFLGTWDSVAGALPRLKWEQ